MPLYGRWTIHNKNLARIHIIVPSGGGGEIMQKFSISSPKPHYNIKNGWLLIWGDTL
jgi:hypothetical protein